MPRFALVLMDSLRIILTIGLCYLMLISFYGWLNAEEYDDDYIVVQLSCNRVLAVQNQFPEDIINMCIKIKEKR